MPIHIFSMAWHKSILLLAVHFSCGLPPRTSVYHVQYTVFLLTRVEMTEFDEVDFNLLIELVRGTR